MEGELKAVKAAAEAARTASATTVLDLQVSTSYAADGSTTSAGSFDPGKWRPAKGDTVAVLRMGGTVGTILDQLSSKSNRATVQVKHYLAGQDLALPSCRLAEGFVGQQVGSLSLEVRLSELRPVVPSTTPGITSSSAAVQQSASRNGGEGAARRATLLATEQAPQPSTSAVAVQMPSNTIDVRGLSGAEAR